MFQPDDPLKPRDKAFDEAWQVQVLAMADSFVAKGIISANDWANALGAALKRAEAAKEPDTNLTYYSAALEAIEHLVAQHTPISADDLMRRKQGWVAAYRRTAHGQPVMLSKAEQQ